MNNIQRKVFIRLLKEVVDILGRKICNDFDLKDVLNKDEIEEFQKYYHKWIKDGDPEFEGNSDSIEMDWLLILYLRDLINSGGK